MRRVLMIAVGLGQLVLVMVALVTTLDCFDEPTREVWFQTFVHNLIGFGTVALILGVVMGSLVVAAYFIGVATDGDA